MVCKTLALTGFQPAVHDAASLAGGERPWDEKSVARRGQGLWIATWVVA
jgi:hypothetical protein